jgi:hypothetical protein
MHYLATSVLGNHLTSNYNSQPENQSFNENNYQYECESSSLEEIEELPKTWANQFHSSFDNKITEWKCKDISQLPTWKTIHAGVSDFSYISDAYGKIIISEYFTQQKSVGVTNVGGVWIFTNTYPRSLN